MAVQKIDISEFLQLAETQPVFDVRSPGEFGHAHIINAYNLPLFTDEERRIVGTAYKQQSREEAIKSGLDFFGAKMKSFVQMVESVVNSSGCVVNENGRQQSGILVHCWRGGMRSSAVAWLLDMYGFKVYVLNGGYKAYRNWVLDQFEQDYEMSILGGYTGSGKTGILKLLLQTGNPVIDLEAIALHKGSAFGGIGQPMQPGQEMFENILAGALAHVHTKRFWLEDESQRIGLLNIPGVFWKKMRSAPLFFIEIPFEERLKNIVEEYGKYPKEELSDSILRIQKKLGPAETKAAIALLADNDVAGCFRILLAYYDKMYNKSLAGRENIVSLLNKIDCSSVDTLSNTAKLLSCKDPAS